MKLKTVSRKLAFRRDDRSGPSLVRITVIFGLLLLAFLTVLFNLRGDVLAQSVVYDSVLLGLAKNHASDHKGSNILTTSSTKSSCIKWCDGTNHAGSGRCESANQIISVTSDLQDFRLQLKRAMDARREMTPQEHAVVAAKFLGKKINGAIFQNNNIYNSYSLYAHALTTCDMVNTENHLWLEFGVFKGSSCNISGYTQRHTDIKVHGFDTFTGLPEVWKGHMGKRAFDRGGNLPPVEPNVELHKGLFNDTLPPFVKQYKDEKIAGMNIDCDLYRGAIESLNMTHHMWTSGTMLHFHELQNIHNSQEKTFAKQEEVVALHEFLMTHPGTILEMLPIRNSFAQPVILWVV